MRLTGLALLQGACAVFFLADALGDFASEGVSGFTLLEGSVSFALVLGTYVSLVELRRALAAKERVEEALAVASGAFADVVDARFEAWGLSPAEADVALFLLKGLDPADIAELRGSAQGTVRAQLTAVYKKADVSGRTQFVGLFLDDLMAHASHTPGERAT